jgi:hypothetical protein
MKQTISVLKKIILKAGFTILKGDLRKKVKDNSVCRTLPAHLLQNARVIASRDDVLGNLPKGGTVVEVGVAYGFFSQQLLDKLQPDKFIAIDTFAIPAGAEPWGQTLLKNSDSTHYGYYSKRFHEYISTGKMELMKGLSWEMLAQLPDNSVDYMYVDADHSYDSVAKDIRGLKNKIKQSGIIQFNDYTFFDQNALMPYGVPKAVNEFMIENNYEILYFCLHPEGFYDVVLKRIAPTT